MSQAIPTLRSPANGSNQWPLTSRNHYLLPTQRNLDQRTENAWKRQSTQFPSAQQSMDQDMDSSPYTSLSKASLHSKVRSNVSTHQVDQSVESKGLIFATLKTNVEVVDKTSVIKQLSFLIAAQFSRPESAVVINLNHSCCVAIGGSSESCYILTMAVSGFSGDVQPGTFIQSFVGNILGVPRQRGLILFQDLDLSMHLMIGVLQDLSGPSQSLDSKATHNAATPPEAHESPTTQAPFQQAVGNVRLASLARLNGDATPEFGLPSVDLQTRNGYFQHSGPNADHAQEVYAGDINNVPPRHRARPTVETEDLNSDSKESKVSAVSIEEPAFHTFEVKRQRRQSSNGRVIKSPWRQSAMKSEVYLPPVGLHSPETAARRMSQPDISAFGAAARRKQPGRPDTAATNASVVATSGERPSEENDSGAVEDGPMQESETPPKKAGRRKSFARAFKLATAATGG